jgi:hypothetical protein
MDYEGKWGGGGPGHSWALKWLERSESHLRAQEPSMGPGAKGPYVGDERCLGGVL